MQPFTTLQSRVIPLLHNDVDTDQIIPAQYLKVTDKTGLAEGLFYRWRYLPDGQPDPAFPLNQPSHQGVAVLLAGDNFGCGSSREHAPWALLGWGIRVVISTSFADIFRSNALKNGLLPVIVDAQTHAELVNHLFAHPNAEVSIDLAAQTVTLPGGRQVSFPIEPFSKACMLEGVDPLGYLLKMDEKIAAFEKAYEDQG